MNARNYQRELEQVIDRSIREDRVPSLLLHSCCAPCSSYVLEYLARYFEITVYYFNPNISPLAEYRKRVEEQRRLIGEIASPRPIRLKESPYRPELFYQAVRGLEGEPEGSRRCEACFRLRLDEAARSAKEGGYGFLTTTLTISPLKNAPLLNTIGEEAAARHGVAWLPCDFKKKGGYQRSVELSREHGLYRQDYCGCVFSKRESEEGRTPEAGRRVGR